jgi:hypothetical protein
MNHTEIIFFTIFRSFVLRCGWMICLVGWSGVGMVYAQTPSSSTEQKTSQQAVTLQAAEAAPWKDGFSWGLRQGDRLSLMYSPFTHHFTPNEEHRYVWMVGIERERSDQRISGATFFSNSFGQPSTYLYPWGKVYRQVSSVEGLFVKWTGGLLYGYVKPYENKVPLNVYGFSPAIIPSIGIERQRYSTQINLLGTAGLMWQLNMQLGQ